MKALLVSNIDPRRHSRSLQQVSLYFVLQLIWSDFFFFGSEPFTRSSGDLVMTLNIPQV